MFYNYQKTIYLILAMKAKRCIVWIRQDLRLQDNESLDAALSHADEVIPVYVFDERMMQGTTRHFGFPKTGAHRAQFIIESVQDLRLSLRRKGLDLVVRTGKPEEVLFELSKEVSASWVFANMERMAEEEWVQNRLEKNLWSVGKELLLFRGKMLYYTQDLPFPVAHTPEVFTTFRKEVEKIVPVRLPLPAPTRFDKWTVRIDVGEIPTLADFGHAPITPDLRSAMPAGGGGETAGLARLEHYLWDTDAIKTYKDTRNGLLGIDYSSKFSAWLAQGCLSPKTVYAELKRYEAERGANESTYWLFFELLWRDYFRLIGKKHSNAIFQAGGLRQQPIAKSNNDRELFEKWATGNTGEPFVDANMRELNATGFMSNRGRQNVASFLVKDLHLNWLMGAEYFESQLIDYDVCSNYCNWNYIAGIGNDPREDRYFNVPKQAATYDPNGDYVRTWLSAL
jgi:deoxyribodipyrimidine photo-lyase